MMHTENSHDDGDPVVKGKTSRSSSSSSSSASSFDPLTDSDDDEKEIPNASITKSEQSSPIFLGPGVVTLPENPAQTPEWSMISASPRAGSGPLLSQELFPQNPEWCMLTAPPKQFPPVQTMGRPGTGSGYDPNRIPTSIFASKPANPMEWSVASNESLFSIHMGNNSFSKDNAILMGKSQDLGKADDFIYLTSTQKPVTEAKPDEKSDMKESGVKEVADEKPKVVMKETAKDHSKEITPPAEGVRISNNGSNVSDGKETPHADGARNSSSNARLSDESGTSSSSFAFPVFTGEGGTSASVRVAPENLQQKPPEKPQPQPQPRPQSQAGTRTSQKLLKQDGSLASLVDCPAFETVYLAIFLFYANL
ncbi:hypothetical protein C3L33_18748, partial [Rhododendron williamsianum]